MILTTHALTGATLGKYIHNPWLLIPMAIIMHFTLDTFRHGEYLNRKSTVANTWWKVAIDLILGNGIILTYILTQHPPTEVIIPILIGAFFSMFPDLLTILYWKLHFKFLGKIFDFHAWVHPYPKGDPRYDWTLRNAMNDIIFSSIAIILLFIF
jgi:hypothetical protein